MRAIEDTTAASCFSQRKLEVRRRQDRYEFREHGGQCGNFAIVHATINPAWVRQSTGGHRRSRACCRARRAPTRSRSTRLAGRPRIELLEDIRTGSGPTRRLHFHGMLTYDYFGIIRTLRGRGRKDLVDGRGRRRYAGRPFP